MHLPVYSLGIIKCYMLRPGLKIEDMQGKLNSIK